MRNPKPGRHSEERAATEERAWRMRNFERAAQAYEDETVRRVLRPLGRRGLLREIGRPATAAALNAPPLFEAYYPLVLEARFTGTSNPPPAPRQHPLPALKRMPDEFPGTVLHRRCMEPPVYDRGTWAQGAAVIFPYGDTVLILHNWPDLTEGPPLVRRRLPNGCVLQVHYFEPFIDDIADHCRYDFAEDGSELMARIESNYEFREAFWEDWADREPPRAV